MRIDTYTRVVLTVIAACLMWLCVVGTPVGTPVSAQVGVQDVRIVGVKEPPIQRTPVGFDHVTEKRLGDWDTLRTSN